MQSAVSEEYDCFVPYTFGIFFLSILGMCASGYVGYHYLPKSMFLPFSIADAIIWAACGWFGWRNPIELVFPSFVIITGCLLGLTAQRYAHAGAAHIFVNAGIVTLIMFAALSIYAFFAKSDFYWLNGLLSGGFGVLLGGGILMFFFHSHILHLAISAIGTLVFLGWVLFDISQIVNRWDTDSTPAEGAFELYLDFIGLYSYILDLFRTADSMTSGSNDDSDE
ncbi:MAG: Bax inhibitor-1 family protein [Deltaproteobacteria bacterium]